jgi:biotin synthase
MENTIKTENFFSPEYVKTSLAGSISLGMEKGQFARGAGSTCLNILLNYEPVCYAKCAYCGLAANRQAQDAKGPSFIRVKWPLYPLSSMIEKMKEGQHPFKRVCVSMVTHPKAPEDVCTVINAFASNTDVPVSALLTPTIMKGEADMKRVKEAGADRVGIAIDTATEELFDSLRGSGVGGPHKWDRYFQAVDEAVAVFGKYNAGVHLIVGIGETEMEMAKMIDHCYKRGALTHLFSFFPEAGSLLEKHERPTMGTYRRMQIARYLICEAGKSFSDFTFSEDGKLMDFGADVDKLIEIGLPFMTSGCPGKDGLMACNRPFSNERPSEPLRNYHFTPDDDDKKMIACQICEDICAR